MMVPNVKVMSETIEAHVAVHTKKVKDQKEAEAEAERVRDDLIVQILEKASQHRIVFLKNKRKKREF